MKFCVLIVSTILLFSCASKETKYERIDLLALNTMLESGYTHFDLVTLHLEESILPHKKDIIELRSISDSLVSKKTLRTDVLMFEEYILKIADKYKFSDQNERPFISQQLFNSHKIRIKFLEYYALNSIINHFHTLHYDFTDHLVLIIPENRRVKVGGEFTAEIYLTANNHHNPLKAVINNDTIFSGTGNLPDAIEISLPARSKGSVSQEAKLLINHMGEFHTIPFKIEYSVE